jgi:DNA-binding transcriptional ArsR family regulator
MNKRAEGESKGRGGGGQKGGRKAKPKGKAKPKRKPKPRSPRSTAQEARERAPGAIDPNVGIIAKDPLRAEIVAVAIQRLYSPSEFARDADIGLGTASYHFKVLKNHRIIELVEMVKVRGAVKHMYKANEAAFIGDEDWGELAPVLRPGVIGATVGNFNDRLAQADATGKLYEREDVRIYWAPREYDEKAWGEYAEILAWCIEESERLECDTVNRRADGEGDGAFKATVGLFLFPSATHAEVKAHEREKRKAARAKAKRKAPKGKAKAKGSPAKGKGGAKAKAKPKGAKSTKGKGKGAAKRKGGKA